MANEYRTTYMPPDGLEEWRLWAAKWANKGPSGLEIKLTWKQDSQSFGWTAECGNYSCSTHSFVVAVDNLLRHLVARSID